MTNPRMFIEGQVFHVTRRTREGRFLLRPSDYINHVMAYELARSVNKYGVELSGVTVMSNHLHIQGVDRKARRSDFMQRTNCSVSLRVRKTYGITGGIWEDGSFTDVVIADEQQELNTLLYVWLNPVKDGLVKKVRHWPGFQILPEHWGKEITVKKPKAHYGRTGAEEVTFTPQPPAGLRDVPLKEAVALANGMIIKAEKAHAKKRKKKKKGVLGVHKIRTVDPMAKPRKGLPSRGSLTRFSASTAEGERQARERYRIFLDRYQTQRQRWQAGQKAVFPCGTVKLRRQAPIKCKDVPRDMPGLYREE